MRPLLLLMLAVAALSACKDEPTPEEKAAADARDVAAVEALQNQKPPPKPIQPQTIGYPDIAKYNLFGAGCAFAPEGGGLGAIVLSQPKRAIIKLDGVLQQLASDPGSSPKMPFGTHNRYIGKEYAVDLEHSGAPDTEVGQTATDLPVKLTITDPYGQTVFTAAGIVQCGS